MCSGCIMEMCDVYFMVISMEVNVVWKLFYVVIEVVIELLLYGVVVVEFVVLLLLVLVWLICVDFYCGEKVFFMDCYLQIYVGIIICCNFKIVSVDVSGVFWSVFYGVLCYVFDID